jgi:EAL domain-containing protein (putative c-di-GMP-specific phosphodiesterase class I)/DNA-binding NarL/FixJ family response regulator
MDSPLQCTQSTTHAILPEPNCQADDETAVSADHSHPRVLFVDDELAVLNGIRRALLECPYRVQTTVSPELALQMFRDKPFDVIVADELMPGMLGSQLLSVIAAEFPNTGRILLTGQGTPEAAARAVNEAAVVRFLLKPCPVDKLREAIDSALRSTRCAKKVRARRRRALPASQPSRARREPEAIEWTTGSQKAQPTLDDSAASLGGASDALQPDSNANALVIQAQRMVALTDRTLLGYELSTRMQQPSGAASTVGNFIAASGQAVSRSVDRWVVRHVLSAIQHHEAVLQRRGLIVSMNIAAQSLTDPDFARFLNTELSAGRAASRFLVEVRESVLAKSLGRDGGLLACLSDMSCFDWNCRLCVDGVGGALWKLALSDDLPVAIAKIDSRFVCDILTNRLSESIVRSAVKWGQQTGVQIAATGIDSMAIAERLCVLGVQYGQGSAFGMAEPFGPLLTGLYC